jgi:hypothetical protein
MRSAKDGMKMFGLRSTSMPAWPAADFRSALATVATNMCLVGVVVRQSAGLQEYGALRRFSTGAGQSARFFNSLAVSGQLAPVLANAPASTLFWRSIFFLLPLCRTAGALKRHSRLRLQIRTARAGVHVTNRMNMTRERR